MKQNARNICLPPPHRRPRPPPHRRPRPHHTDTHGYAHSYTHGYAHTDTHGYAHSYTHGYAHTDTHGYAHSYTHGHSRSRRNGYRGCEGHSPRQSNDPSWSYSHSQCQGPVGARVNANTYPYADGDDRCGDTDRSPSYVDSDRERCLCRTKVRLGVVEQC